MDHNPYTEKELGALVAMAKTFASENVREEFLRRQLVALNAQDRRFNSPEELEEFLKGKDQEFRAGEEAEASRPEGEAVVDTRTGGDETANYPRPDREKKHIPFAAAVALLKDIRTLGITKEEKARLGQQNSQGKLTADALAPTPEFADYLCALAQVKLEVYYWGMRSEAARLRLLLEDKIAPPTEVLAGLKLQQIERAESFGTGLKLARLFAGLRWKDLAKAAGVENTTVSRWESGEREPTAAQLAAMCEKMGLDEAAAKALKNKLPQMIIINDPTSSFGALLRAYCELSGSSQEELAEAAEVGRTTVGEWESGRGEPTAAQLAAMCEKMALDEAAAKALKNKLPQMIIINDPASRFGDLLKAHRELAGLFQEELAKAAGVENTTVSRWESGKGEPTAAQLAAMCGKMGMDEEKEKKEKNRLYAAYARDLFNKTAGSDPLTAAAMALTKMFNQKSRKPLASVIQNGELINIPSLLPKEIFSPLKAAMTIEQYRLNL